MPFLQKLEINLDWIYQLFQNSSESTEEIKKIFQRLRYLNEIIIPFEIVEF